MHLVWSLSLLNHSLKSSTIEVVAATWWSLSSSDYFISCTWLKPNWFYLMLSYCYRKYVGLVWSVSCIYYITHSYMHIYNYHNKCYCPVSIVFAIIVPVSPSLFLWGILTVSVFIFSCNWMICGYNCR